MLRINISPATFLKIENGSFLIVGKRTQLICGEMHYSCIPHEYWRDRLKRTKAMGLNTISTYVLGNFHKRQPDIFDFKGQADLSHFIKLTQEKVFMYYYVQASMYVRNGTLEDILIGS